MARMNRRRAKQSESAEVRIEVALLSFQCNSAGSGRRAPICGTLVCVRALVTITSTTRCGCGDLKSTQTISIPRSISRSSRPNTADLQPQVPPLSNPRFKHHLFKDVDNPIVELNDVARARAPWNVVHNHSSCGALTRHRGARLIPSTNIQTHETLGEPHCTVGTSEHERRAPL
jgi:hypothetical protein